MRISVWRQRRCNSRRCRRCATAEAVAGCEACRIGPAAVAPTVLPTLAGSDHSNNHYSADDANHSHASDRESNNHEEATPVVLGVSGGGSKRGVEDGGGRIAHVLQQHKSVQHQGEERVCVFCYMPDRA